MYMTVRYFGKVIRPNILGNNLDKKGLINLKKDSGEL